MNQGADLLWKEVKTPEIARDMNWNFVYRALGFRPRLHDFLLGGQWRPATDKTRKWSAPVIQGLSIAELVRAHTDLGSKVCFLEPTATSRFVEQRDPGNGSYQIDIFHGRQADLGLRCRSVRDLDAKGIRGCTLTECLLFGLEFRFRTSQFLDDLGSATICSGSRFGDLVPTVQYNRNLRAIQIGVISTGIPSEICRVRQVFDPIS